MTVSPEQKKRIKEAFKRDIIQAQIIRDEEERGNKISRSAVAEIKKEYIEEEKQRVQDAMEKIVESAPKKMEDESQEEQQEPEELDAEEMVAGTTRERYRKDLRESIEKREKMGIVDDALLKKQKELLKLTEDEETEIRKDEREEVVKEKDVEIENVRKGMQAVIDELQADIRGYEENYKSPEDVKEIEEEVERRIRNEYCITCGGCEQSFLPEPEEFRSLFEGLIITCPECTKNRGAPYVFSSQAYDKLRVDHRTLQRDFKGLRDYVNQRVETSGQLQEKERRLWETEQAQQKKGRAQAEEGKKLQRKEERVRAMLTEANKALDEEKKLRGERINAVPAIPVKSDSLTEKGIEKPKKLKRVKVRAEEKKLRGKRVNLIPVEGDSITEAGGP